MKIVLLEVPSLHVGFLGAYGNDWIATPNFDRLASTAIVFDRHHAGTATDLVTGCFDFPHPDDAEPRPNLLVPTLGQQFPGLRFTYLPGGEPGDPAAWSAARRHIASALAVSELVWAVLPTLAPPWLLDEHMLSAYFDEDSEQLPWPDPPIGAAEGERPVYLERLRNTYSAAVTVMDAELGELLTTLEPQLDDGVLLLTSAAGLPLGEHGYVGAARAWQHEERVHLPLVVRLPGCEQAGLRVSAFTQSADVLPTLLELLDLPAADMQGSSLVPLLRGTATTGRPFVCSGERVGSDLEWALRDGDWAYLLPLGGEPSRRPQLYVKPDDRWEVNDVQQHHPEIVDELDRTLREFVRSTRRR